MPHPSLKWKYTLTVPVLTNEYSNKPKFYSDKGKVLAKAIRASRWYKECGPGVLEPYQNELEQVCDEISDAEDERHFNLCLQALYDLADTDRCILKLTDAS